MYFFVFFKQKTAYEMRISDWSSDVCSSDLNQADDHRAAARAFEPEPDQRRQKTAARHHHKNRDQQAPHGQDRCEHRPHRPPRHAARRPSARASASSTSALCSTRTAASKSLLSTMNWTSTLRI